MLRERDGELALAAAAGAGGVLAFSGPLGIGRSALLAELAAQARARGARVLRAVAAAAERDRPGALRDQLGGDPPGPGLVVVDDLHCADAESLRWLAEEIPPEIALVFSHRCGEIPADPDAFTALLDRAERRELAPLSAAGVAAVVHDVFGTPGEDDFLAACLRLSCGRPLFLAALLHGLRDTGGRPESSCVDALAALRPAVLGERACAALRGQPGHVRDTARAIALLEPPRADLVGRLTGAEPQASAAATAALVELGLLLPEDPPRFAHPVLGAAVEAALSPAESAEWHSRASHLLHAEGHPPEEVARHLLATGAEQGEWGVGMLHVAGRSALERGDEPAALRALRRALLACPAEGAQRAALLADLARAERAGEPVAAMRHLAQALPGLAAGQRAAVLAEVPPVLLTVAPRAALSGLEDVPDEAIDTRLRAARLAEPDWFAGTVRAFAALAPEAAVPPDRAAVLALAAALNGSDVDAVRARGREVLAACRDGAAFGTGLPAADALLLADEVDEAERWLAGQARDGGSPAALLAAAQLAGVHAHAGRIPEAAALAERTLHRCDPVLWPVLARCAARLAACALDTGDPAHGGRALERCAEREHALPVWVRELRSAALAVLAHDAEAGLEHLLECGRELERIGWTNPCLLPWRSWAALLHHRMQRPGAATELLAEEYRRAVAWGAPSGVGRALRVWGAITPGEAGIDLIRRAIDVLRGPACALELARAHLALGHRLPPAEAADHLAAADRLAAACGLPRLRDAADPEGGPPRAELTRAELRVARLAAGGLGNRQIAEELGVSSRAVEKHLTHVYRKLGIPGRSALPDPLDL